MQHSRRVKSGPRQQSSLVRLDDHSSSQAHQRSRVSVTGDIPLEDEEEIMLAAATISAPRPKPDRPVYLITADRNDPLRRTVRDVTQHHKPKHDVNDDRRVRDTEKELVDSTQPYTSNFNMTLTKLPRTKRAAELVRDRMKAEGIAMHAETYNLLLSKVADIRDPIAFEIFEDFKAEAQRDDATVRPDLVTLELLMRACERSSDYRRAFHIYTQMKELFGVYPDVPLYNTLIGFCAPLRDETTASFIMDEMKDRHVEPDVHTYNALMNVFVDAPYEVILQTFQDMVKRKLKPNRRTFNTLMKACQRIGDFDSVFQFFEELKRGLTPDVTTYNILFVACRDRIDFVLGTGKFSEQRRTKEHRELGTKAIAQLSRSLLTEMEEQGISPNTYTYNALLAVLSQCRDRRMFDVFAQMKEDEARSTVHSTHAAQHKYLPAGANVPRPPFAEMERMLEEAIATAANGDGDEGQDDRLSAAGVRPTLETYSTLIQGCHRMGLPDDAYRFFSEMKERNIKPDRGIFIKLIDVCALKTEKQRAFDLFQEARQSGMTPDTELYNSLINVLAECCDPRVIDIFNDLKYDRERLSIKPNQDSYNLMLKAALRMKSMDNALRLYEEMTSPSCVVAPDTTSYGILMDVCAACKDVRRASYFIEDLRRRNVAPSINTYSRFMQVFVACGDPGVVDVFENIKKHGPQPNLEAYTTLLTYYLHTKNDAIVGLFEEMQRDGVDPDLNAFNIMLNFAAAKGSPGTTANHQRAYKYLDELQKRRLNADIDTYNALIAVFAPSGADMIFKVFEDMAVCHVAPDATTLAILMKYPKGRSVLQQAVDRGLVKVDPALLASA